MSGMDRDDERERKNCCHQQDSANHFSSPHPTKFHPVLPHKYRPAISLSIPQEFVGLSLAIRLRAKLVFLCTVC